MLDTAEITVDSPDKATLKKQIEGGVPQQFVTVYEGPGQTSPFTFPIQSVIAVN